ncbi:MAG: GntR family transcriptional regulator [Actinobacteria bacterium]|nr:GntR family transcriptional regulator [Actinomycetota bacterium]
MDGTLAPGTPLREVGLAEEFDVSRRTVQDALAVLAGERLVRHERHRGARVARLDRADVEDLYMIRLELELMAVRQAKAASAGAREELERAYDELRIATSVGRAGDIVARDLDFHRAVVGLLESPRIDAFFSTIASELRYALSILESYAQEASTRPKDALREHAEIRDALLGGDEKLARKLITEHVTTYRERLVSAVDEEEREADADADEGRA